MQSSFSSKYGHSFDLTKGMAREKVEAVETILVDLTACEAKSVMYFIKAHYNVLYAMYVVVAEWLRRWTRNPLGSPRVGSNPTDYAFFSFFFLLNSFFMNI